MVQSLDDARRRHGARSGTTTGGTTGAAGRVPPNNLQAEESLLGAMLLSRDAIAAAVETCATDDFYKPAHGHVFDAICSLYAQGEPADPVTVADELRRVDLLDAIGGPGTLITLQANTPATTNAGRYARIVEEHALLRRLIGVAGEIAEIGYGLPEDVAEAVDRAESMVFEVAERRVTDTLRPLHDLLSESLDRLEALYDRGEAITGVPTGFIDLDERLSGLQPSSLVIIGARPSMGKALALDTPIPTPTGWTTMGDLRAGEQVLDDQGRPCRVTYATPVMYGRTCYRVTFDDGSSLVADADHQWFAYDAPAWKAKRERHYRTTDGHSSSSDYNERLARDQSHRWRLPRVVTTQQMIDEGVRLPGENRPNWYIPLAAPLELPDRQLPLDPYLLGVWLGDGNSSSARVTTADHEIVAAFHDAGYQLRVSSSAGAATTYSITYGHDTRKPWLQKVPDVAVVAGRSRVAFGERPKSVAQELALEYGCTRHDGVLDMLVGRARPYADRNEPSFVAGLVQLGVLKNKHVPAEYLRASRRQRMAVLQGLMDTDGTVDRNGRVEICLANHDLLAQVQELALSLGHKPGRLRQKVIARDGRTFVAWRLSWGPLENVFRLTAKADRLAATSRITSHSEQNRRAVVSIEPCVSVPVRCITVDSPNHLYLAGEAMIPTHNTAMALGIAAHAAMEASRPVLFFSLEMSHSEVTQRLLCAEARVESTRVRNGKLMESDWPKISNAIGRLGEAPLYIDDNPNLTVMEIRAKARRLRSRIGDLGLIVIDYLQLMSGRHNAENRQVEVSEISRGLKILARELEVPVIALSQLSRNLESRSDKRPVLADLRESGSLEQDADVVMFLYRDEVYNPESDDRGTAEVIISKHRNGPTGITNLAFLNHYTRFDNIARI